jgi:hypothetical protein
MQCVRPNDTASNHSRATDMRWYRGRVNTLTCDRHALVPGACGYQSIDLGPSITLGYISQGPRVLRTGMSGSGPNHGSPSVRVGVGVRGERPAAQP